MDSKLDDFVKQISSDSSPSLLSVDNRNVDNFGMYDTFISKFLDIDFFAKLINVCLYPAELAIPFSSLNQSDIIKYKKIFLNDLATELKTPSKSLTNPKIFLSYIQLIRNILISKESIASKLITYDNLDKHFPSLDISTTTLVNNVKNNRIADINEFRKQLEENLTIIESYNQIKTIKKSIQNLDKLKSDSSKSDTPILNLIKGYRDGILEAYNDLSNLKILNKEDQSSDHLIFNNERSVDTVVEHIKTFFSTKYSIFRTGYDVLDDNLSGIESSTVTIISGPSNHAKSIFMLNLLRNMIINNKDQLTEKDLFLIVTLEDDINKLLRRILSIFGNNNAEIIKKLFIKGSEIFKEQSSADTKEIEGVFTDLLLKSIISVTNNTCTLLIKHNNENSFSAEDLRRLMDKYKMEGYNLKCVAIDYIDCMIANTLKHNYNDYDAQGQIVQDLRLCSRVYSLPIITITQNNKTAENLLQAMNNSLIGDSYKKIRFGDTIIMIRQREDLDITSEIVKRDVLPIDSNLSLLSSNLPESYFKGIIPFEAAITKAKEGSRSKSKFHLFSRTNLRIYGTYDELKTDIAQIERNSDSLLQKIEVAGISSGIFADYDPESESLSDMSLI